MFILNRKQVLITGLVFGIGILAGWLGGSFVTKKRFIPLFETQQLRLGTYHFINPLVACGVANKDIFEEFGPLKNKIADLISQETKQREVERISVYFREIDSGRWTGVNETENYIPASLIKVPLMIAYFKVAETNPEILTRKIVYEGGEDDNVRQSVQPPPTSLKPGKEYTIEQLIERMIEYSGNNSYQILVNLIDPDVLRRVYTDLGLTYSKENPNIDSISAKSFATFFRVLYNASYLNRQYSQKALELLSLSTFKDGLVAGVPSDIEVAHKFGERTVLDHGKTQFRELHDCGIIYHPNKPYLLCVMTQGQDFAALEKVIANISRLVYSETPNP